MTICSNCSGLCCRLFNLVAVTGKGILRIKNELNLPYGAFLKLLTAPDEEVADYAAFKFKQGGVDENAKYVFSIKNIDSELTKNKKCIFLKEEKIDDKITSMCQIYEIRPSACRAFPSALDEDNKTLKTIESIGMEEFDRCLSEYNMDDFGNLEDHINMLLEWKKEKEYFKQIAEIWNENPGTVEELYDFIELVYANTKPETM